MKVFIDEEELNFENVHVTEFSNIVYVLGEKIRNVEWDFSNVPKLKGNKDLLEKAFEAELNEQII